MESSVKLRISVWCDFVPDRPLLVHLDDGQNLRLLRRDSDLQQEVFSWQMREDPLAGIADEHTRQRLRELLLDAFNPSLLPSQRRFSALHTFMEEVEAVLRDGTAEWTGSQDAPADDDEAPYRLNPLLALRLHIEWLYQVFKNQPGVSVSIR